MDYFDEYTDYSDDFGESDYNFKDFGYNDEEDNYDVINDCLIPTLSDGLKQFLIPILVSNLFLRILLIYFKNLVFTRLLTIGTGLLLLYYHLSDDSKLLFAIIVYLSLGALTYRLNSRQNSFVWMICIGFVCINESLILMDESMIRLRPHIMLLVMKIISFNTIIEENNNKLVSLVSYLLDPLSLLLGVWHPFHPFQYTKTNKTLFVSLIKCFYYLMLSTVFLVLSTCLLHYYIGQRFLRYILHILANFMPNSLVYLLELCLTVYISAQQFRFSHYFICFATQSMLCLWNSDLKVTNPLSIEFPRSLVDVVIAWNIPMHIWLKTNVFNPSKRRFGAFRAIFITYFISSFLHGFNFQIWSVLLSLGILTKLEYDLREELSQIFKSCIHVRRCIYQSIKVDNYSENRWKFWNQNKRLKCVSKWEHTNTPFNSKRVSLVNLLFSLLAVAHLSYLGSTFDGKEESSQLTNVLSIWKELKFFSHIVSILTFIFYKWI